MKVLVVLPSFNEAENIVSLIEATLKLHASYDICVVDDNSPDGTAGLIKAYISGLPGELAERIHLIVRSKKDGRGGAVRDGIKWGLSSGKNYEAYVEMDCDFSHDPRDLEKGLSLLKTADVVIGARYPDGTIIGWPMRRRVMSYFANCLAKSLISWKVSDYTNGFRFYSIRAAGLLCEIPQQYKGYIYLSESLSYLMKARFPVEHFPIVFKNRERGVSNTGIKEVFVSFLAIFKIGWKYRFGRNV